MVCKSIWDSKIGSLCARSRDKETRTWNRRLLLADAPYHLRLPNIGLERARSVTRGALTRRDVEPDRPVEEMAWTNAPRESLRRRSAVRAIMNIQPNRHTSRVASVVIRRPSIEAATLGVMRPVHLREARKLCPRMAAVAGRCRQCGKWAKMLTPALPNAHVEGVAFI